MYEIRNKANETIMSFISLKIAKETADDMRDKTEGKEHFFIYKVEQVWATSTLDDCLNNCLNN